MTTIFNSRNLPLLQFGILYKTHYISGIAVKHFCDSQKDGERNFLIATELCKCSRSNTGELAKLCLAHFTFCKHTKSYQRIRGEDVITPPKTDKSIRRVLMPDFFAEEILQYIDALTYITETDRIFQFTKSYLHHEMRRGCAASGIKRIRIHGIRHSHISLLIDMGFSAIAIADRVGHESIDITYRYAHVFPSTQVEVASKLNDIMVDDN